MFGDPTITWRIWVFVSDCASFIHSSSVLLLDCHTFFFASVTTHFALGARIRHYLLEKVRVCEQQAFASASFASVSGAFSALGFGQMFSAGLRGFFAGRVVWLKEGERNYHIFYEACT